MQTPEVQPSSTHDKVQRLSGLLGKFHESGGDVTHMPNIRELVRELKAEEAEILHSLAKENATLWGILGGPTLAFATDDEDTNDD